MGYCAAPNCKNKSTDGIRLFRFPRDKKRQHQWVQNCRRDKWQPTHNSKLCERHFEESQFEQNRADGRKLLKWNAVPTLFNEPNPPESVQWKRNPTTERHLAFQRINKAAVDKAGSSAMVEGEEYYNAGGGEWLEKLDTGQLCRICANPNEYLIPIFEGEGLEHELALKIKKHLPIEVSEADTLPRQVCYQCASTLIAWHDLVICCVEANKKLQELQAEENQDDQTAEAFEAESYDSDTAEGAVENKEDVSVGKEIDKTTKPPTKRTPHLAKEKKSKQKSLVESSCLEKSTEFAESVSKEEKASESVKPNEGASQESSERWCRSEIPVKALQLHSEENSNEIITLYGPCDDLSTQEIFDMQEKESESESNDALTACLLDHTYVVVSRNKHKLECHQCKLCDEKFATLTMLKYHHKCQHQECIEHKCYGCDSLFTSKSKLQSHCTNNNCGLQSLKCLCHTCGKMFNSANNLQCHQRRVHATTAEEKEKPYICKICNLNFSSHYSLRRHILNHREKKFVCEICGKCFALEYRLKMHQECHSEQRPYICKICVSGYKTYRNLLSHEQEVHGIFPAGRGKEKESRSFTCNICKKEFTTPRRLAVHERTHTGERPYICEHCGQTFRTNSSLHIHRRTVHEKHRFFGKKNYYRCEICEKIFSSKQNQEAHMETHEERPLSCEVCGITFLTYKSVQYHRRVMHVTQEESCKRTKYPCKVCGRMLSTKQYRELHMRIHRGERPYSCEVCGRAFTQRSALVNHTSVHTDIRPFPCTHCDKSFRRRDTLLVHVRTHTGEKPYVCEVCGRGFAQQVDMRKHCHKIHNLIVRRREKISTQLYQDS